MTAKEARAMLSIAPSTDRPAAINRTLTQAQVVMVVREALPENDAEELPDWMEKRVYQVCRNQKRPRY